MTRPFAYVSAPWSNDPITDTALAAFYCRKVYVAGYTPICPAMSFPAFLKSDVPDEVKDRQEMSDELLKRCRILVVCDEKLNDEVRGNIALAKHCRISYTTLDGVLALSNLE